MGIIAGSVMRGTYKGEVEYFEGKDEERLDQQFYLIHMQTHPQSLGQSMQIQNIPTMSRLEMTQSPHGR